jgi:H+-translocating NAD(P) transhydrogenase subunit alpha
MRIRVHRETAPGERRVALTPKATSPLVASGHQVAVPAGAGAAASFTDDAYEAAGATIFSDDPPTSDLLVGVGPLRAADTTGAAAVLGFLDPLAAPDEMAVLAETGVTALALELIPRITLAQTMDALTSQATVVGYQAVILAADRLPRFFPMMMTAAGTIRPARVLVLGAGVAGLQAVATARRLGAAVSGYDIRPAAREQIESLGASFVGGPVQAEAETAAGYAGEVDEATRAAQQEALAEAVAAADVVITAAQVQGARAPILVTATMVESMRPGTLVVDLAASTGGNCELTRPGEVIDHGGVTVHGPLDLASRTAADASEMYARNVTALVQHLSEDGTLRVSDDDEIAREVCVTRGGEVVHPRVRALLEEEGT